MEEVPMELHLICPRTSCTNVRGAFLDRWTPADRWGNPSVPCPKFGRVLLGRVLPPPPQEEVLLCPCCSLFVRQRVLQRWA